MVPQEGVGPPTRRASTCRSTTELPRHVRDKADVRPVCLGASPLPYITLPLFILEVTVPLGDNGQSRTDVHGVAARCLTTWLRYHIWQAVKESNLYQRSQSPLYYLTRYGDADRTRTRDLQRDRLAFYSTELRRHIKFVSGGIVGGPVQRFIHFVNDVLLFLAILWRTDFNSRS